jgi:regulator of RNase E activity RraA
MSEITADQIAMLQGFDTPTICNALELIMPERRAKGFTTEHLHCADPSLPSFVGFARTSTIRAIEPSSLPADELAAKRAAYYQYVAAGDGPRTVVIQDLDPTPGIGAFWGEVNSAIHKGLGCGGVITNGSVRDLDERAPGFQMLAGKFGPSHAHVHTVEFGCDVNVFGMKVSDGDLIHADKHGAVVVPVEAIAKMAETVDLLVRREAVILDCARSADFNIDKLLAAMADSKEIH